MHDSPYQRVPHTPKVFVSYSHDYQDKIKEYVDRLIIAGGIDVIVDFYDLEKGGNMNKFMEKVSTDPSIDYVLLFCDKTYMEKANARKHGVGAEASLIIPEINKDTQHAKFLTIACEVDDSGNFTLPAALRHLNCFDFTSYQTIDSEFDDLIRLLHRTPKFKKPKIGPPPNFIQTDMNIEGYNNARTADKQSLHTIAENTVKLNQAPLILVDMIHRAISKSLEIRRDAHVFINKYPDDLKLSCYKCFLTLKKHTDERIRGEAYYCLGELFRDQEEVSQELFFHVLKNDHSKFVKSCCADVLKYYIPLPRDIITVLRNEFDECQSIKRRTYFENELYYYSHTTLKAQNDYESQS